MSTKLARLQVSSLRAIPKHWPAIEIGEKGLIVYGPNGVGKSSLVDAIELALKGECSLFPENRLGVSWEKGATHIRGGKPRVVLTLKDGAAEFAVIPGEENAEPVLREWLAIACDSNFVLRRHMLLRFVDTTPRERYDRLEPFLNLGRYLDLELALKRLVDSFETTVASLEAQRASREQVIRHKFFLPDGVAPTEKSLLGSLNQRLGKLGVPPAANFAAVERVQAEIQQQLGSSKNVERLTQFHKLRALLSQAKYSSFQAVNHPPKEQHRRAECGASKAA